MSQIDACKYCIFPKWHLTQRNKKKCGLFKGSYEATQAYICNGIYENALKQLHKYIFYNHTYMIAT